MMTVVPDPDFTIRKLVDLRRERMIVVNPEYQRGEVWKRPQQKRLIDSILRGYPLPFFFFHHIKRAVGEYSSEVLEVIDGQQRMNAICAFYENAFKLFDPAKDAADARFPRFIGETPCPWARCDFDSLSPQLKADFLDTKLPVNKIIADDPNAPRDLFIRLQAGMPLNAQEKRDAWPGKFTEFVLRAGGKPEVDRYPGHEFFTKVMGAKPAKGRGKFRQFCAQMAMLFLTRRATGRLCDTKSEAIDDFYYQNLDFDDKSADAQRFLEILDKLALFFGDRKRPYMKAHEAIHLVLLMDLLLDDYAPNWESKLCKAFDGFMERFNEDRRTARDEEPGEFWSRYGQWTRTNADSATNIGLRHEFFCAKVFEAMAPLQLKDRKRSFGPFEREIVYYRDKKLCSVCNREVAWRDAEVHHVKGHAKGGPTTLRNATLVHGQCHPKGVSADEFEQQRNGLASGD
jgi:hypothetical protein